MVSKILPHTRLLGKSTATILAFHWANHVSGPASDAAPNKTIVRSDKSNHSGCSTQAISASAWLGSITPASNHVWICASNASPVSCWPL